MSGQRENENRLMEKNLEYTERMAERYIKKMNAKRHHDPCLYEMSEDDIQSDAYLCLVNCAKGFVEPRNGRDEENSFHAYLEVAMRNAFYNRRRNCQMKVKIDRRHRSEEARRMHELMSDMEDDILNTILDDEIKKEMEESVTSMDLLRANLDDVTGAMAGEMRYKEAAEHSGITVGVLWTDRNRMIRLFNDNKRLKMLSEERLDCRGTLTGKRSK